ncbi:MAG TPA: alpha-1,4-glucan--maltose-1-phosphate maltosyltransferase [Steroidobacteraceae bacterium]|jgi:starch synthase (maltosyl-transferring)|nr:alpha-1,4-glucan--maltose-1-phosphate maltosyltransferase [Steroidobacteraceae bacterium]
MSQPQSQSRLDPRPPVAAGSLAAIIAPRVVIERLTPFVDGGRFPAKAVVGQTVVVEADIFIDGHEKPGAQLLWRSAHEPTTQVVPMRPLGNDRWRAEFTPSVPGAHSFNIEAWLDVWASYRSDLLKNAQAGAVNPLDIQEGREQVLAALQRTPERVSSAAADWEHRLADADIVQGRELLSSEELDAMMRAYGERRFITRLRSELLVDVERAAAGFASWYELFPRSQTRSAAQHGTFDDVISRLPAIRSMGFNVVYFPPIHPIGVSHRKGRNNALTAAPSDPGSPYAIGAPAGGHDSVHPLLGGITAFRRLVAAAHEYDMEIALDFAVHCSRDHPWLTEHPGWFSWRSDGSIRYAENPPKKYQDIVNFDFYAKDAKPSLWLALRDVVQGWVDEGVRMFRVDNPHTKPVPFWQWLIADIRARTPEVIFLAEAFTRPAMMYRLGKIGFSQSYTYFTWRNSKHELTEYFTELTTQPTKDFYRPHLFVNTPDINPYFLQTSGRPGFLIRAALAATLSGLWGLYSGYELCECAPLPGREEYRDSEKYEIRVRDWNAPGNIISEISRLNYIRKLNPSLHSYLNLKFYNAWNDQILYYGKSTTDLSNFVLVLVSLDPHQVQETHFEAPLWEFGLPDSAALEVEELMRGQRFIWRGKLQHWRFVPQEMPFAIFRIRPIKG